MLKPFARAVAVLMLFVAIALGIAQDQETLRVEAQVEASDPEFAGYLAALTGGVAVTTGDRYEVLDNGDQAYSAMLDAIGRARRRISFETYVYVKGVIADQFTKALSDAARRGVSCRVTIDAIGAKDVPRDHVERLGSAGCVVAKFNDASWYQLQELNYRTHRKILVVDGAVAFIGGIGVADYWMGHAQDADHWRDTQFAIRGPIVRAIEAGFYENFIESVGPVEPVLDPPPAGDGGDGRSLVLWSSPVSGSSNMKLLYLLSIAGARHTLDICSSYLILDESSLWAIDRAIDRGVRVRVLVESDITDAKPVKFAGRAYYDHLLARGVQIYEYLPTMMHAKTMIVDGTWSVFGSANFDNRSLELNDELNVGVFGRAVAARLTADFEQDLTRAQLFELSAWRARPAIDRMREQFWSLFGEVF